MGEVGTDGKGDGGLLLALHWGEKLDWEPRFCNSSKIGPETPPLLWDLVYGLESSVEQSGQQTSKNLELIIRDVNKEDPRNPYSFND